MADLFEKSIETLELPRVLALLADQAVTQEGKERALALRPETDPEEVERLLKEKDNLIAEVARAQGKLSNEKFVAKAPEAVINAERDKLVKYNDMLASVNARIAALEELG